MGDARRRRQMREVLDAVAALPDDAVVEARDVEVEFIAGSTETIAQRPQTTRMLSRIAAPPTAAPLTHRRVTHAELTAMEKDARLNTQCAQDLAELRHKRFLASLARHGKLQ